MKKCRGILQAGYDKSYCFAELEAIHIHAQFDNDFVPFCFKKIYLLCHISLHFRVFSKVPKCMVQLLNFAFVNDVSVIENKHVQ